MQWKTSRRPYINCLKRKKKKGNMGVLMRSSSFLVVATLIV